MWVEKLRKTTGENFAAWQFFFTVNGAKGHLQKIWAVRRRGILR
jgi:hypothetical protein